MRQGRSSRFSRSHSPVEHAIISQGYRSPVDVFYSAKALNCGKFDPRQNHCHDMFKVIIALRGYFHTQGVLRSRAAIRGFGLCNGGSRIQSMT